MATKRVSATTLKVGDVVFLKGMRLRLVGGGVSREGGQKVATFWTECENLDEVASIGLASTKWARTAIVTGTTGTLFQRVEPEPEPES